jgi:hypothetical protein
MPSAAYDRGDRFSIESGTQGVPFFITTISGAHKEYPDAPRQCLLRWTQGP